MSGWNPDANGYAMLSAVEYGRLITEAGRCFDAAMRAESGFTGRFAIANAIRAHRNAIRELETIRHSMETSASERLTPSMQRAS